MGTAVAAAADEERRSRVIAKDGVATYLWINNIRPRYCKEDTMRLGCIARVDKYLQLKEASEASSFDCTSWPIRIDFITV